VANDLHSPVTLWVTAEFTVERNRTSVHCVTRVSAPPATCRHINDLYTATVDRLNVLTVGSCLRFTVNWSCMFVFTLMQSRTNVDTDQTVLHGIISSSDICWSHTVKVLGSHVTFVRRNSAPVVSSSNTFSDMKLWSRMFAVNVQSVSTEQLIWDFIIQYIWNTNSLSVVCVINCSNVRGPLIKIHFKKCLVEHGVSSVVL